MTIIETLQDIYIYIYIYRHLQILMTQSVRATEYIDWIPTEG